MKDHLVHCWEMLGFQHNKHCILTVYVGNSGSKYQLGEQLSLLEECLRTVS
jgi:hypothetical protein